MFYTILHMSPKVFEWARPTTINIVGRTQVIELLDSLRPKDNNKTIKLGLQ